MRIRSWHFAVRQHRELIPRSVIAMQMGANEVNYFCWRKHNSNYMSFCTAGYRFTKVLMQNKLKLTFKAWIKYKSFNYTQYHFSLQIPCFNLWNYVFCFFDMTSSLKAIKGWKWLRNFFYKLIIGWCSITCIFAWVSFWSVMTSYQNCISNGHLAKYQNKKVDMVLCNFDIFTLFCVILGAKCMVQRHSLYIIL